MTKLFLFDSSGLFKRISRLIFMPQVCVRARSLIIAQTYSNLLIFISGSQQ